VNTKQRLTHKRIFENPTPGDLKWKDIESLFEALGAEISEGRGSRVRIALNGVKAVFHRPHPSPSTKKGAVKSVRMFLENAGKAYEERS
jgi:hypothetical protein